MRTRIGLVGLHLVTASAVFAVPAICRCAPTVEAYSPNKSFPFALELSRTFPRNMLKNGGFELVSVENRPDFWRPFNPVRPSSIHLGVSCDAAEGKTCATVRSGVDHPGYWTQDVQVVEGECYYCSVLSRFDGECHFLLWVRTSQYSDSGNPHAKGGSNTDVRDYAVPGQAKDLEDFIGPRYLDYIDKNQWSKREVEFVVPTGRGVNTYTFSAGIYGAGWAVLDDAYFGPAAFELKGTLKSRNLKALRILGLGGRSHFAKELDACKGTHSFQTTLPSRLEHYSIEVTDTHERTYRRAIW